MTSHQNDLIEGSESGPSDPFDPNSVSANTADIQRRVIDANEAALSTLRRRKEAYVRLFNNPNLLDDAMIVMGDLTKFCRGDTSTYDENDRTHCLLTGRNEVYRRIKDHVELSYDTLTNKYLNGDM